MNVKEIIGYVIKLLILLVSAWTEKDKEKKILKTEAYGIVKEGIKKKDISMITKGFDNANNI